MTATPKRLYFFSELLHRESTRRKVSTSAEPWTWWWIGWNPIRWSSACWSEGVSPAPRPFCIGPA